MNFQSVLSIPFEVLFIGVIGMTSYVINLQELSPIFGIT